MALTKLFNDSVVTDSITSSAVTSAKLDSTVADTYATRSYVLTGSGPTISSFVLNGTSIQAIEPSTAQTIDITGTNFQSGIRVQAVNTSTGALTRAYAVTLNSSTSVSATFNIGTNGTYELQVVNPNGANAISGTNLEVSTGVTWSTAANLGSHEGNTAYSQTVAASSDSTVTYSETTSVLTGASLSLNSTTGAITGTPNPGSTTTYTFTIRATDAEGQTADREFTLQITYLPTGGDSTNTYSGYKSHTFTSSGNFVVPSSITVDYIIVGGGGGGGSTTYSRGGGGGGAGGVVTNTSQTLSAGTYAVVVGTGGTRTRTANFIDVGSRGGNSSFNSQTATGGGLGNGRGATAQSSTDYSTSTSIDGGSGGGGATSQGDGGTTAGEGKSGEGYAGRAGRADINGGSSQCAGGGGGASGTPSANAFNNADGPAPGGDGVQNAYQTGSNIYYAGGGGGAYQSTATAGFGGEGGNGGGGRGTHQGNTGGTVGTDGLGGGGGGGNSIALDGGDGVVIIRYAV